MKKIKMIAPAIALTIVLMATLVACAPPDLQGKYIRTNNSSSWIEVYTSTADLVNIPVLVNGNPGMLTATGCTFSGDSSGNVSISFGGIVYNGVHNGSDTITAYGYTYRK